MVGPDGETGGFQEGVKVFEQEFVLEDAAGENDSIYVMRGGECLDCGGKTRSDAELKSAGNFFGRAMLLAIASDMQEQRAKIELVAIEGKRVGR